ncbi:protein phosphatase 1 regulatory subunit 35 isoform X2 [Chelonia mydas]|uniref:protein phosphatase 1 regulatory subunit 35 isoform X2 n=1 Tax=Chelonia mydas TaxID=8469 RepID=UPI001CAA1432|nr:protein phosphatase 1 regulatory subunit 35 isoform X2 [Chelonia mydas]
MTRGVGEGEGELHLPQCPAGRGNYISHNAVRGGGGPLRGATRYACAVGLRSASVPRGVGRWDEGTERGSHVGSEEDEFRTWSRVWVCSFPSPGSDPLGSPQPGEKKRPLGKPGCSEPEAWDCEEGLLPGPWWRSCSPAPKWHLGDAPGAPNGTAGGGEEKEQERDVCSAENTSLFSSFQHVAVGLAFAKGRPFRQPPRPSLTCSPSEWRVALLALALGHFLRSAFLEVRFLLGSAPDDAPPSPEPPAPHSPPVVAPGGAEAPRAKTGLGGPAGDLAAPQLLTSLALGEEVQAAARRGFDAHRAAQELLATSFLARCSVEGKAAAGMNIPREQQLYQGLVSLQVPAEEVLSSALQEKLSLVRSQPEPHREPDPEGPDLLMFYEPLELFAETPYLGVEGLPPLRLQPHVRPPASAFLMFRKLQQWEA